MLVPNLRPGDVVVLDDFSVNRSVAVQPAALVCAPAFNPIELAFVRLKQRLRTINRRTADPVMAATQQIADISPKAAMGYNTGGGFAPPVPCCAMCC